MSVQLFDVNYYRAVNQDLTAAGLTTDAQLLSHFQTYGLQEGRTFSRVVDLNYYRASNSDLAAFNNQQLFEHLQNHGVKEGRKFSSLVDLKFYGAAKVDLSNFNSEQLFEHLSSYGINEGRLFSPFVNLNYYRTYNGDLASFNNLELFSHLKNYGIQEGRDFSPFVDLNFYRAANGDLASFNFEQLLNHLSSYGVNEGRVFSPVIDLNYYQARNGDLASFKKADLLQHLILYGLNEKRTFSQYFDVNYYNANNSDLAQGGLQTNRQLLEHFLKYGIPEGREFNKAFDFNYYRNLNEDLSAAGFNNKQLLSHFQLYGLSEGRISSPNFNVSVYLANNPDLIAARFNNRSAYNHFLEYGQQEGRSGSDYAGNSFGTARNVNNNSTFTDFVGGTDTKDFYRISINSSLQTTVRLDGMTGNADIKIFAENGEEIIGSFNTGTTAEVITRTFVPAVYFVEVSRVGDANTNYNLTLGTPLSNSLTLYDGASGGTPKEQGKMGYGNFPFIGFNLPSQQVSSGGTRFNSYPNNNLSNYAGYSNYDLINGNLSIASSNFPTLDRSKGFSVRFDVAVNRESHSTDTNNDGLQDRAGFSVVVLDKDRKGVELGFWTQEIWAQRDGANLFTHSPTERVMRDTTSKTRYDLSFLGDSYTLFANGTQILTGSIKDYTPFQPSGGFPPYDPYELSNLLFFGDNTTSAGADITVSYIGVSAA